MTAQSVPFPIIALLGIMLSTLLGISVERIAYRPLRNAPRFAVIIGVLGMSIFLQNMARIVWGAESQTFDIGRSSFKPTPFGINAAMIV
jgi:branched-chain amino acid transport system permease protein